MTSVNDSVSLCLLFCIFLLKSLPTFYDPTCRNFSCKWYFLRKVIYQLAVPKCLAHNTFFVNTAPSIAPTIRHIPSHTA